MFPANFIYIYCLLFLIWKRGFIYRKKYEGYKRVKIKICLGTYYLAKNKSFQDGTYGQNCKQNCSDNCYNNMCNVVSGLCVSGCRKGWMGPYCQQRKFIGFIIYNTDHTVNSINSMCHCLLFLIWKRGFIYRKKYEGYKRVKIKICLGTYYLAKNKSFQVKNMISYINMCCHCVLPLSLMFPFRKQHELNVHSVNNIGLMGP
jgi:hypothetical protein